MKMQGKTYYTGHTMINGGTLRWVTRWRFTASTYPATL